MLSGICARLLGHLYMHKENGRMHLKQFQLDQIQNDRLSAIIYFDISVEKKGKFLS